MASTAQKIKKIKVKIKIKIKIKNFICYLLYMLFGYVPPTPQRGSQLTKKILARELATTTVYIYRYRGTQRAPTHSQERKIERWDLNSVCFNKA